MKARVAIVMGVSGTGKSTLGHALAARLDWAFYDADDLHSAAAKAKMAEGHGLTDADRAPWLQRVRAVICEHLEGERGDGERGAVVACSALRAAYRHVLAQPGEPVRFLWLDVPASVLAERLAQRPGHYARADLLPSQLRTLEPPTAADAIRLDGTAPLGRLVAEAERLLAG